MNDLIIRPAVESEVPLIHTLIRELADTEEFPFPITVTESLLRNSLFGDHPAAEALLGFLNDKLVGFAVFYETFATTTGKRGLHLDDLFIRSEFQGKGYGRVFLRHLARIARNRDCARFEWWTLKTNINAIRFFQSVGARPMEELLIFRTHEDSLDKLAGTEAG
jgi:GNAT superfamily N-acetyltransferase